MCLPVNMSGTKSIPSCRILALLPVLWLLFALASTIVFIMWQGRTLRLEKTMWLESSHVLGERANVEILLSGTTR